MYFPQELQADVARFPRGCDMACKASWQSNASPRRRLRGTEVARTRGRATRVHADSRAAPTWREVTRLASDGPTG